MRFSRPPLALVLLAIPIALAGCLSGNDDDDSSPTGPDDPETPWYQIDDCSGGDSFLAERGPWADSPVLHFDQSFPEEWRGPFAQAVAAWNAVGTRIQIQIASDIVSAGQALDGRNVISYGPIVDPVLGRTYSWTEQSNATVEADIVFNTGQPLSLGGSETSADVQSVATHELGHLLGLGHVEDRTQTMFADVPANSRIFRTLCDGDVAGMRALYGSPRNGSDHATRD